MHKSGSHCFKFIEIIINTVLNQYQQLCKFNITAGFIASCRNQALTGKLDRL